MAAERVVCAFDYVATKWQDFDDHAIAMAHADDPDKAPDKRLAGQEKCFDWPVPAPPCDVPCAVGVLRADQVTWAEGAARAVGDLDFEEPADEHDPLLPWCPMRCGLRIAADYATGNVGGR